MAQNLRRRLRDRRDWVGILRAFRGTAVASVHDHTGHGRRANIGGVHARRTRTVRESKGKAGTRLSRRLASPTKP